MIVMDLFDGKYMCFKNKLGSVVYWTEDACGYTNNYKEAGVFDENVVKILFNLTVLTPQQIHRGDYRKYTHFAARVSDAAKFFF